MEGRKQKKAAICIAFLLITISLLPIDNWELISIYEGCGIKNRMLYSFFHVNLLHASLNAWCLLCLVFIYRISLRRLLFSYCIASLAPIELVHLFSDIVAAPTVGGSVIIFFLMGSISFEVARKRYYQAWMGFYLFSGFLFPNTNAFLHLYGYLAGLLVALLNKPIKIK